MIRRHYLVEIKCVKELPLSTLLPPHHGPLPRITSQSDGITVRPWSQREFCNTFLVKADMRELPNASSDYACRRLTTVPACARLAQKSAHASMSRWRFWSM